MQDQTKSCWKTSFSLLCCLLFISRSLKAQGTKRFKEGQLQTFPEGTEVPSSATFVQSASPTSSQSIKGIFYTEFYEDEDKSHLRFLIFYRNNSEQSSPKESLILEFCAPFKLDGTYQHQTNLYTDQASGTGFHLNSTGLGLYDLDQDFNLFKGEDLKNSLALKTLKLNLFIEKTVFNNGRNGRRVEYKMNFKHFEVYYVKDSVVNRLNIEVSSLDDGPMAEFIYGCLVFFIPLILIVLQNGAIHLLESILASKNHRGMFVVTSVYALFVPVTLGIVLKYQSGFWSILSICVVCLIFETMNITTLSHLRTAFLKKDSQDSNMSPFWVSVTLAVLLSLGWVVILVFMYDLLLRAYVFFALLFIIELAIAVFGSKTRVGELVLASILVATRGFLIQMFIYMLYFALYYAAHLSAPPIVLNYILVDFGVLGVLLVLSLLLALAGYGNRAQEARQAPQGGPQAPQGTRRGLKYQTPISV